jgi:formate dehydrogenase gamma subunit
MSVSPPPTVVRFTSTERVLHWTFALLYLVLLASGLPLMFPELRGWIRGYTPVIGFRLHLTCGVLWALATLLVIVLGDREALRRTWRQLTTFGREDAAWLLRFGQWLSASASERARLDAAVGRFNAGQKLNALFTVATSALLLVSGVALIPVRGAPLAQALTGPASIGWWRLAHEWLTMFVLVPIAGHVFFALAFPATRPSLPGILSGQVGRDWAATHHPRWRSDSHDEGRAA